MGPTCTVCTHPKAQELNDRLQSESGKKLAAELGMSLPAVYRHVRSGHHLPKQATANGTGSQIAPRNGLALSPSISATLRAVQNLAKEAQRHLKEARASDDLKATNGAITAATKALELVGKLRGELQHGANVNVTVSATAQNAVALHDQAAGMTAQATSEHAKSWLAAQIEAGDREAMRMVLELVRMIPEAGVAEAGEASQRPQATVSNQAQA